jgi:hypothetical protein
VAVPIQIFSGSKATGIDVRRLSTGFISGCLFVQISGCLFVQISGCLFQREAPGEGERH